MEVREPAIAYSKQKISIEEYLEIENTSTEKHEYYKGEVFAMSGAKMPHNTISKNLSGTLFGKLKDVSLMAAIFAYILRQTLYLPTWVFRLCAEK